MVIPPLGRANNFLVARLLLGQVWHMTLVENPSNEHTFRKDVLEKVIFQLMPRSAIFAPRGIDTDICGPDELMAEAHRRNPVLALRPPRRHRRPRNPSELDDFSLAYLLLRHLSLFYAKGAEQGVMLAAAVRLFGFDRLFPVQPWRLDELVVEADRRRRRKYVRMHLL